MKDCNDCICLQCDNGNCFVSECEGATVEPEYYAKEIEGCHKTKCESFIQMQEEGESESGEDQS